jgi:predicted Holliday junction resolvase-like endonuclease
MIYFTLVLIALVIYVTYSFNVKLTKLKEEHQEELLSEKAKSRQEGKQRSAAVQWGLSIENFVPFMDEFPIPVEDVNFLGKPIDYVGYTDVDSKEECAVHFIEVKSGRSQLLKHQRHIKKAIQEGRVHWHEVRVDSNKEK